MTAWIAVLITLSFIIVVHEWGHFIVARLIGVKVERFSIGFGPKLLGLRRGDTEYCLCLFPFGGYVKMAGESDEEESPKPAPKPKKWEYRGRSIGERIAIVMAGPAVNYLVGFLIFVVIFLVGAPILSTKIGKVMEDYPAARAGLKEGDRILAVNGRVMDNWEEVTEAIHSQTGPIELKINRAGQTEAITIQPTVKEMTNLLGATVRVGMVGIAPSEEVETRRYPLPQAVARAGGRIYSLTHLTLQALWRIATGGLSVKESMTGPVGIFYLTSSVAQQGFIHLLQLVAILSTSLGIFNILPLPVLDGGHCLFLLIEKVKGSPVTFRTQEWLTRAGMALLLLLLVVVTYNDLVKFKIFDRFFP